MTLASDRPVMPEWLVDRRLTLQGGWSQFKLIQQGCEHNPGVRLFYWQGAIEIFMPGQFHEIFSRAFGWMLTYFLLTQKQLAFTPTGSMTQEKEGFAAAEANESYWIGEVKPIPDLALEIVVTSGGLKKLEIYQALGVPEVWFWQDGRLQLYHLRSQGYEQIVTSELPGLADLDLSLLQRCVLMAETNVAEALSTFAQAIGTLS
ncbi:MAG: Uma2 family endonuclease [Synechococcales bacterium]|nr:Uma2 family endonuclease [Synechococcales bacterium]